MQLTNFKKMFDEEIKKVKTLDKKPKLLLHACCAPCSSAVLEELSQVFEVTLFFYNPNISPKEEFSFRLEELRRLIREMGLEKICVDVPEYDHSEFLEIAKGLENLPEGGERCRKCYRLRIDRAVLYAKENEFDYVTTTLSISPHKNAGWLNEIGMECGEKYGIKYLCSDFKKGDGYKRSCAMSREYNLYRQNYCGCIFSKMQAEK